MVPQISPLMWCYSSFLVVMIAIFLITNVDWINVSEFNIIEDKESFIDLSW